jgi:hypothetical protein
MEALQALQTDFINDKCFHVGSATRNPTRNSYVDRFTRRLKTNKESTERSTAEKERKLVDR